VIFNKDFCIGFCESTMQIG